MNVFHFIKTEYALEALLNQRLKVALIHELNDPSEFLGTDLPDKAHRESFEKYKDLVAEDYGILCFSREWEDPALWNNYANSHQGVALAFYVHDEYLFDVTYNPEKKKEDVEKALQRGTFNEEEFFRSLATKSPDWQYEDEVRMFCPLANCKTEGGIAFERFSDDILRLEGLVLGPRCILKNQDITENLPPGCKIYVTHTRFAFNSSKVVRNKMHPIQVVRGAAD